MTANNEIKLIAKGKGVKQWEIANAIGVSEGKLCRLMRTELAQEHKDIILAAIESIANGDDTQPSRIQKEVKPIHEPEGEYTIISSRIKSLLNQTGMTQTELGKLTGILQNTISQFCSGNRIPNAIHIIKIADAFNVSADYILGRTEISNKDIDATKIQLCFDRIIRCIDEAMNDATP